MPGTGNLDTLGRHLIAAALPSDVLLPSGPLNSKVIRDLYQEIATKHPDKYREIAKKLSDISARAGYEDAGAMSFGPEHLRPTPEILAAREEFKSALQAVLAKPNLSDKQRNDELVHVALARMQPIQEAVMASAKENNNPLYNQVVSGSKGKPENLKSLLAGDTLYTDADYQPIPFPVVNSFYNGLRMNEYYGGTYGARLSIVTTKLGTAAGGYASKRLRNVAHRLVVSAKDNEKPNPDDPPTGFKVPLSDPDNEGAALALPIAGYPRNTILTRRVLSDIKRAGHEHAYIRSPMVGGPPDGGVYSYDAGIREKNMLAPLGDQIGLASADAIGEPMQQTIIGCLAAGTLVRMADWSTKKIEEVRVGDMVIGSDVTGRTFPVRVNAAFDNGVRPCVRTTFSFGKRDETLVLESTVDHKVLATTLKSNCKEASENGVLRQLPVGKKAHQFYALVADADAATNETNVRNRARLDAPFRYKRNSQESIGDLHTYDIEVDHPDHLFLLNNGLIVSNSKHTGGVAGATKGQQGFPVLDRMLSPSADYPGATHAETDGTVQSITPAPYGGKFVTVDGKEHYVAPDFDPIVKTGDKVEAGDPLSNGPENPSKFVEHQGIGQGRLSFMDAFSKASAEAGFRPFRRNLELIARGLIDHVHIDKEYGEHSPGDIVSYTALAHGYEPRPGHTREDPKSAIGKYLERPALHYSIGTRVTPRVASTLSDGGVRSIPVHVDPPPFTPVMVRSSESINTDRDWITRMLGSGLEKNLLKGVVRGDISDPLGTSWASNVAIGSTINHPLAKTKGWEIPPGVKPS